MKLKLDYEFMTKDVVKGGVAESDFLQDETKISSAYNKVMSMRGKDMQVWSELPFVMPSLSQETLDFCYNIRRKAENIVLFGIGGSSLGTNSVIHALKHKHLNERKRVGRPAIYIEDNISPVRIKELFDVIDCLNSYFIVITKSGDTPETLSQFFIAYEILKRELGNDAKNHVIAITTPNKGSLYKVAMKEGFRVFGITEGVGGRFSVFDNVGLIPLCIAGVDIESLMQGARNIFHSATNPDIKKNIPLMTAYLKVRELEKGKNINVYMPYSDKLQYMADFYCQIWAESLGKEVDLFGKSVNVGQTPVKALGATDQHSQLQLYAEGPFDKVITFLAVEDYGSDISIPASDEVRYLNGHTIGELLTAERNATAFALVKKDRPNYTLIIPKINEETVGELLALMMYETAFAGAMLNINTFNQPGVEDSKNATFAMLGRTGFDDIKDKIYSIKSGKYII